MSSIFIQLMSGPPQEISTEHPAVSFWESEEFSFDPAVDWLLVR